MALCSRCGGQNAARTRTVYTGYSTSQSGSTRNYYGVRLVCNSCAKAIDEARLFKSVFIILIIAFGIYKLWVTPLNSLKHSSSASQVNSEKNYAGQVVRVAARNGANIRDKPNSSGRLLSTVPHNDMVRILDKNGYSETIGGLTANWFKVEYYGTKGWLWSSFLQRQ